MCKLTPQMIENAKQMIVNLEVAKTMDRKNQTRRLIKSHINIHNDCNFSHKCSDGSFRFDSLDKNYFATINSKYKIGDILWIREPVQVTRFDDILQQYDYQYVSDGRNIYQADIPKKYKRPNHPKWMEKLHRVPNGCLKSMARTFVKITNVRVERLQDIDSDDIMSEGFSVDYEMQDTTKKYPMDDKGEADFFDDLSMEWWINLWDSTAPKGYKWEDNPYVFVYEYERIKK